MNENDSPSLNSNFYFSKRIIYILIFFLIFLNIAVRIPFVSHERAGYDSYFNHSMAQEISINGYASWFDNPLSYFGLYPYSYPSGNPFLISGYSLVSGIDIEHSILILDFILPIISLFGIICIAHEIFPNPFFIFICGTVFSIAPKIIEYSYWLTSGRTLLALLIPIFYFLLIKVVKKSKRKVRPKI